MDSDSEVPRLDVDSEGAAKFVREAPSDVLIFVSGSSRFMSTWQANLSNKKQLVLALDCGFWPQKDFPDITWQRVCHDEVVGGVTACRNWIGSSTGISLRELQEIPYRRSIGEVLKPTLKGRFGRGQDAPKGIQGLEGERRGVVMETEGIVSPYGLWPVSFKSLNVVAPSVYAGS